MVNPGALMTFIWTPEDPGCSSFRQSQTHGQAVEGSSFSLA